MSQGNGKSAFSASDATLGYLYQVRSALLWALRRLKSEADFLVSIETLDDVVFENSKADATDLLQTKHHLKAAAGLTDASPDLWKTLRIWFEGYSSGEIPVDANLYLVTTAIAPDGAASSKMRATSRDIGAAQAALDATASSSTNIVNKAAYAAYTRVPSSERIAVLNRITIIDAAPLITDLNEGLRGEVYWAAGKEHHSAFLERLEGWWLRRIIVQLASPTTSDRIGSVELETQMSDLREQFKQEALPIDDDLIEFTLDAATEETHQSSVFVAQLKLVKAGKRRIAAAIRDYYRAYEQRSRWLRENLVVGFDLSKYEKRLKEEWELIFDAMRDNVGAEAADEAKEEAARSVLQWAESTTILIRPGVTEPFVCRGSLHMLSDQTQIGWHPEFQDRLRALLATEGGSI